MTDRGGFQGAYKGKKVLITGHTGFKGSWLSSWLLELGALVTGYSKDIPTRPAAFEELGLSGRLRHVIGDVLDLPALTKVVEEVRPDFVFHLAAQSLVRASYRQPVDTFATNVMGTVHVLDAVRAASHPICVVNVTSDKCYENQNWHFGYRETDALGGHDPYSASKGAAEIVFASYFRSFLADSGVRAASARAGNVIGGGDFAEDRLIPDCIRAWSSGNAVTLRNPQSIRPWQHVLEPLSGYLTLGAALAHGNRQADATGRADVNGEAFNFGPTLDAFQPVAQVVEGLRDYFSGAEVVHMPPDKSAGEPHEAKLLKLAIDKAASVLDWEPTLTFAEALEWTGAWYGAHLRGSSDLAALTTEQIRKFSQKSA